MERLPSIRRRLTMDICSSRKTAPPAVLFVVVHNFDHNIHVIHSDLVLRRTRTAFPTRRGGEYVPLVIAKACTRLTLRLGLEPRSENILRRGEQWTAIPATSHELDAGQRLRGNPAARGSGDRRELTEKPQVITKHRAMTSACCTGRAHAIATRKFSSSAFKSFHPYCAYA